MAAPRKLRLFGCLLIILFLSLVSDEFYSGRTTSMAMPMPQHMSLESLQATTAAATDGAASDVELRQSDAAATHRGTAIVMMDTRLPTESPRHLQYCIAINLRFARRHAYAFLFYRIGAPAPETEDAADGFRGRHPSWARIPALWDALRSFDVVAYLDSDAIFNPPHRTSLEALWAHAVAKQQSNEAGPRATAERARVLCYWNQPYATRRGRARAAHTGFLVVRRGALARALLLAWWWAARQAPCCERYAQGRDWEQGVFNDALLPNATWKRHIAITRLPSMIMDEPLAPRAGERAAAPFAGVEGGRQRQFLLHYVGHRMPTRAHALPHLRSRLRSLLLEERGAAAHITDADLDAAASASVRCLVAEAGARCRDAIGGHEPGAEGTPPSSTASSSSAVSMSVTVELRMLPGGAGGAGRGADTDPFE